MNTDTPAGSSGEHEPIGLLDGMATTRAIRRYVPGADIPTEDLNKILFAATRAPQGSNRQGFRFVILRDGPNATKARSLIGQSFQDGWAAKRSNDGYDEGSGRASDSPKARMARTMQYFVDHVHEAPVIVLACLRLHRPDSLELGGHIYPAVQNLLLAARALGYGGVITGWHRPIDAQLRELISMPTDDEWQITALIPLGVPQGGHGPVRRRPMNELVFEDTWGEAPAWAIDPPDARFTSGGPKPRR